MLAATASLGAMLAAGSASAQSVSPEQIEKMQAQIQALQQQLQSMKKKVDTAEKAYAAAPTLVKAPAPPPSAIVKMSAGNRPSICTPDGLNCIALTSRLHFDVGGYSFDPNTAAGPQHLDSGVNARRARIGVLGTFLGD
jgi:phosphate-selective porin OprO/OprP